MVFEIRIPLWLFWYVMGFLSSFILIVLIAWLATRRKARSK